MQLDLTVLTKRKEMIRYCELFGYGDKYALNISIMGFSLTSSYT
jgi:hypothetical protein